MNETTVALKTEVERLLVGQGYTLRKGLFLFDEKNSEERRRMHQFSRAERIKENIGFIRSFLPKASGSILDSSDINVLKIKPKLIEVESRTEKGDLFRWWNLVWWSLPHERPYGRQMRFIVWDEYHDAPIGLIGLHSPILSWSVRDKHLGISAKQRDYWVNQSLSAQRLGSLPPYNKFLGGKLVASLMVSNAVRDSFKRKYEKNRTLLMGRTLPANLLFITTTGAYGKSSVYNRLKFQDQNICDFIGYTSGNGSFHIPNSLYESFISYLREEGYKAERSFGNGPSIKMKNIDKAMGLLGFKNGNEHGMKRAVYLFPLVKNLKAVIQGFEDPVWCNRKTEDLFGYWKYRWAYKRIGNSEKNHFRKKTYLEGLNKDLENCERTIKEGF